jgi:hypothetical protein
MRKVYIFVREVAFSVRPTVRKPPVHLAQHGLCGVLGATKGDEAAYAAHNWLSVR